MGEDLLSVVFLALVCIVIAGIVHKMVPSGMMVPTFALIAICLWVAYDYMMLKRYKAKQACADSKKSKSSDLDDKIAKLTESVGEPPIVSKTDPDEKPSLTPKEEHKNEFDIAMYDRELSVQELFKDMGCTGDTRMANRMKYMGLQPKMSIDVHARLNSEKLRPFFEEEMHDNEVAEWWNVENNYLDNLM
jgi:hypothetical protein